MKSRVKKGLLTRRKVVNLPAWPRAFNPTGTLLEIKASIESSTLVIVVDEDETLGGLMMESNTLFVSLFARGIALQRLK